MNKNNIGFHAKALLAGTLILGIPTAIAVILIVFVPQVFVWIAAFFGAGLVLFIFWLIGVALLGD